MITVSISNVKKNAMCKLSCANTIKCECFTKGACKIINVPILPVKVPGAIFTQLHRTKRSSLQRNRILYKTHVKIVNFSIMWERSATNQLIGMSNVDWQRGAADWFSQLFFLTLLETSCGWRKIWKGFGKSHSDISRGRSMTLHNRLSEMSCPPSETLPFCVDYI